MSRCAGWVEVGERCWSRRYPEWDVNVGVVAGRDGLLVIDTRAGLRQGEALRADVRVLGGQPVRWVVNTHVHFDHTFGNAAFGAEVGDGLYAHANAAAALLEHGASVQRQYQENPDGDPDYPDITATVLRDVVSTPLVVPPRTFTTGRTLDLGDRQVQLRYLGRGHTDGDAVLVADGVVFPGDLIEQSGSPSYGEDCYPLDWPDTLTALTALLGADTVVVPGHGRPVRRDFVAEQSSDVHAVAAAIRALFASGVALAVADWPFPAESLADAVRRGYAELGARR